jgi:hypothetical protein
VKNLCHGKSDVCIGLEREGVWAGRKVSQASVELTSPDLGDTHRERLLEAQAGQVGKPDTVAHAELTNRGAQFIVADSFASVHSIIIFHRDRVHGDGPLLFGGASHAERGNARSHGPQERGNKKMSAGSKDEVWKRKASRTRHRDASLVVSNRG